MVKFVILLCVAAAAFVSAKPNGNQDGETVVTFVDLVHNRPHLPSSSFLDAVGSLTRSTGTYCNAANRRYTCDGSCFEVDTKHLTWKASGLDNYHRIAIDYFSQSDCSNADGYLGTTYADTGKCYGKKDFNAVNAKSFSCVTVPSSQT